MDSRLIKAKALPKPLLLKDYLLDDMSSCSSNGFRSLPRRQCCTSAVRFLIEIDLKNRQQQQQKPKSYLNFPNRLRPSLLKSPAKSALSVIQSIVTAVKRFPFGPSATSPEKKTPKKSILPRNLSKRILKKTGFWKRESNDREIKRWKSLDQLLKDSETSGISHSSMMTADFTVLGECPRANFSSVFDGTSPAAKNDDVGVPQNGDVSIDPRTSRDNTDATNSSTEEKQWSEQFSPVSVLDCPFEDDDEEVSSPCLHRLANMEGTNKKPMKKIEKLESLSQLEPVNLAKRFAFLPDLGSGSPLPHSSASIDVKSMKDTKEEREEEGYQENQAEHRALDLLNQMDTLPSYGIKAKADELLLDFFTERILAQNVHSQKQWREYYSLDEDLLEEAENWINGGRPHELFLEWGVPRSRQAYVIDMEKGGAWKSLDQANREVAAELEGEVFGALLQELLVDTYLIYGSNDESEIWGHTC